MEIPTGYAQVNLLFGGAALPSGAQVTFGLDASIYAGSPTALATDVLDAWEGSGWPAIQITAVHVEGALVKFGPIATGPSAFVSRAIAGGDASGGLPPNTSYLLTKRTALGGRAGRGRMYVPGVDETEVDGAGFISTGQHGFVQAAADSFLGALDTNATPMVLLHNEGSPIATPTIVTELEASQYVATQRRRLRR